MKRVKWPGGICCLLKVSPGKTSWSGSVRAHRHAALTAESCNMWGHSGTGRFRTQLRPGLVFMPVVGPGGGHSADTHLGRLSWYVTASYDTVQREFSGLFNTRWTNASGCASVLLMDDCAAIKSLTLALEGKHKAVLHLKLDIVRCFHLLSLQ